MPTAPLRPCRHPGCGALVKSGVGYCAAHVTSSASYRADKARADETHVRMRRASNWRKVSELVRQRCPLCCDPFNRHGDMPEPARQVHHVESFEQRPDLAFDLSNLAAVCTGCHAEVERRHRAGEGTAHLFAGKTADHL